MYTEEETMLMSDALFSREALSELNTVKMIRRSNQTVHCATAVMIQMNAEISTKWKWKGGTNSYLNRNYVMGAMKRHRNHILLVIVQFEEPVRYVLVSTQLVFMASS